MDLRFLTVAFIAISVTLGSIGCSNDDDGPSAVAPATPVPTAPTPTPTPSDKEDNPFDDDPFGI